MTSAGTIKSKNHATWNSINKNVFSEFAKAVGNVNPCCFSALMPATLLQNL
ncbi:hypothetical protein V462_19495 [Pantoea ananatis 15320]|nr:hypothetical protein V462_19495 [Pantoea ananatis 15320]